MFPIVGWTTVRLPYRIPSSQLQNPDQRVDVVLWNALTSGCITELYCVAEVDELDGVVARKHDIVSMQVTVKKANVVAGLDSVAHLNEEIQCLLRSTCARCRTGT
jgi:hypothetical protein